MELQKSEDRDRVDDPENPNLSESLQRAKTTAGPDQAPDPRLVVSFLLPHAQKRLRRRPKAENEAGK